MIWQRRMHRLELFLQWMIDHEPHSPGCKEQRRRNSYLLPEQHEMRRIRTPPELSQPKQKFFLFCIMFFAKPCIDCQMWPLDFLD